MSNRSKLGSIGSLLLVALVASGVVVSSAGVAQASPVSLGEGVHSPSKVSTVAVPGTNIVVSGAGAWSASITLPGTASSEALAKPGKIPDGLFAGQGEPVLSTKLNSAVISSYATGKGTQTLINIASNTADREYRFPLSLPAGSKAAIDTDGSVVVRTAEGAIAGGYRAPWAYDALGRAVPTRFSLDGEGLVQSIDFDQNTAFPVTADPSDFWGWAKCIATVTAEVAANALVAGKVAKLVARFGSIQRTFEILFRAWNAASGLEKKWQAVVAAGGGLAGEVLGIGSIKEACFDS
jgi:hypothetical protein